MRPSKQYIHNDSPIPAQFLARMSNYITYELRSNKQSQHIDQTAQIFELLTGVSFHTMNCPSKKTQHKLARVAPTDDHLRYRMAAPSHASSSCLACIEAAAAMSAPPVVALICCWWNSWRSRSISFFSAS